MQTINVYDAFAFPRKKVNDVIKCRITASVCGTAGYISLRIKSV